MTIQGYCAKHTVGLMLLAIAFDLAQWLGVLPNWFPTQLSIDDFPSLFGKGFFVFAMCLAILPVFVNLLSMLGNMIVRGRWAWVLCTFILAFGATVAYYFSEYRAQESI